VEKIKILFHAFLSFQHLSLLILIKRNYKPIYVEAQNVLLIANEIILINLSADNVETFIVCKHTETIFK
jgi:hypothetical protein